MILGLKEDHAEHGYDKSKDHGQSCSIYNHEGGKKNSHVNGAKLKQKRRFFHE
jgi:hypothetical protein